MNDDSSIDTKVENAPLLSSTTHSNHGFDTLVEWVRGVLASDEQRQD